MRASGVLSRPSVEPGGHACWRFADDEAFPRAAAEFLAEGLERGERLLYVADQPITDMRAALSPLGDPAELGERRTLVLQPVRDLYEPGGSFDVDRQVEAYGGLVEGALADGYTGLRVAADATALVRTEEARRRFVRYELAVDRVMATRPMTALCAYDERVVGPSVAELFAVHPLHHGANGHDPGFRAYYTPDGVRIAGEVDLRNHDLFAFVLEIIRTTEAGDVTIDLSDLTFIDAGGLRLLDRMARGLQSSDRALRATARPMVRRCSDLLDLRVPFVGDGAA